MTDRVWVWVGVFNVCVGGGREFIGMGVGECEYVWVCVLVRVSMCGCVGGFVIECEWVLVCTYVYGEWKYVWVGVYDEHVCMYESVSPSMCVCVCVCVGGWVCVCVRVCERVSVWGCAILFLICGQVRFFKTSPVTVWKWKISFTAEPRFSFQPPFLESNPFFDTMMSRQSSGKLQVDLKLSDADRVFLE